MREGGVTVAHGWVASQQGCDGILGGCADPWLGFPRQEAQGRHLPWLDHEHGQTMERTLLG